MPMALSGVQSVNVVATCPLTAGAAVSRLTWHVGLRRPRAGAVTGTHRTRPTLTVTQALALYNVHVSKSSYPLRIILSPSVPNRCAVLLFC